MNRTTDITAIILSGGASSRMGSSKGLVLLNGKPMIRHVLEVASSITKNVVIIANDESYGEFGFPCYRDLYPGLGPLAGIHTGLFYSHTKKNLVLSCDIPFVSSSFLSSMVYQAGAEEVLVPEHDGNIEPLCAVYDKSCAVKLNSFLESGILKMQDVLKQLITKQFPIDADTWNAGKIFANINTQYELEKFSMH